MSRSRRTRSGRNSAYSWSTVWGLVAHAREELGPGVVGLVGSLSSDPKLVGGIGELYRSLGQRILDCAELLVERGPGTRRQPLAVGSRDARLVAVDDTIARPGHR